MAITIHNEGASPSINTAQVCAWLSSCVTDLGYNLGELSIIFCSDEYLLEMNKKHLNHNYYTDIITFNYNVEKKLSGDLFISVDRIKENAKSFNENFNVELFRVMIHGVLHLCGFNDKTIDEQKKMRRKENQYLGLIT